MQKLWISESRKHLVCVDSYEGGVLVGWLYSPTQGGMQFLSLSQLLLTVEALLDGSRIPQSYTVPRRFTEVPAAEVCHSDVVNRRKGKLATFELSVLFRQNASWQGLLRWQDKGVSQTFRSVLELVQLMDSALRGE